MTQPNAPSPVPARPGQDQETPADAAGPRVAEAPVRPDHAHMVEDRYIGQRVEHAVKPAGQPQLDLRVTPDDPSVYVAAGKPKD